MFAVDAQGLGMNGGCSLIPWPWHWCQESLIWGQNDPLLTVLQYFAVAVWCSVLVGGCALCGFVPGVGMGCWEGGLCLMAVLSRKAVPSRSCHQHCSQHFVWPNDGGGQHAAAPSHPVPQDLGWQEDKAVKGRHAGALAHPCALLSRH